MKQLTIFDLVGNDTKAEELEALENIIKSDLLSGSSFADGRKRILNFFKREQDVQSRARFLRNEYGMGGIYGTKDAQGRRIEQTHGFVGITYKVEGMKFYKMTVLNWEEVARRIGDLIINGEYKEE